ncbi:MAG: DNA gyrase C-terminal beta-propeller domain-containing protein, partial [Sphingobacterium sp.]
GELVAIKGVTDDNDLMIINKSGIVIRISVENLRVMGRATQGVKLITLKGTDSIASITKVEKQEEEELEENDVDNNKIEDQTENDSTETANEE